MTRWWAYCNDRGIFYAATLRRLLLDIARRWWYDRRRNRREW